MKRVLLTLCIVLFVIGIIVGQGVTTSSLKGQIIDESGELLPGANVTAVHEPTGSFYGASTDLDGRFRIDNMRVGGPYKITISYVGYEDYTINDVHLRLGETYTQNVTLGSSALELGELVVVAKAGSVGANSGSSTQITTDEIEIIPTLNRNLSDYTKLTPQASGNSFAGTNNRFNAIYVDGAVNNDVFGLAGSGTNGGQTGISPFSIDIIDQIQVVLSPYDVTLGGFAGAGINAVTKSGTNEFKGTAYYFLQNQSMVKKTNGKEIERNGGERIDVPDFSQKTYGASLGGPIVKNKVFFFTNVELQKDVTPRPFNVATYTNAGNGRATASDLNGLSDFLMTRYGYDPGTFGDTESALEGTKIFGKLDFNLKNDNTLTLRHQYTRAESFRRNSGSSRRINFSNNGVFFPSVTNSSALELNSRINNNMSNNLIIGYTTVNDDRGSLGQDFPFVIIDDNRGEIRFGTEPFSTANLLEQKIFTLTNNFKWYNGKHTWTIGTHNEFYSIRNVFLPWNYGQYEFDSLEDFLNEAPASDYRRVYSLLDNIAGDGTAASAEFNAMQLGLYAQDQIQVNERLNISVGLRLDVPILTDDPEEAPRFNDEVLPRLAAQYDLANEVQAGKAPSGQLMFSPRLGFEYQLDDRNKSTLRGGVGIFTSRIPFVWPGAMYNTNGLSSTFLGAWGISGDVLFRPDVQNQYTFENPTRPSGDMNLFTKNFKYPQVLRGNLAWDKQHKGGWTTSFEALYTKTLNNVVMTNINTSTEVDFTWTGSGDNRPVFRRSEIDEDDFGAVYVGSNTSQGYTYNITASVAKEFGFGLKANLAYSFSDAKALNEGTSSQNSSQWRGQININGRNNPVYGRSDYSVGHRLIVLLDYNIPWGGKASGTNISMFYQGQAGQAISYVIGDRSARNINNQRGSTSRNRSLIYVPSDQNDINLIDLTDRDGNLILSAQEQWNNLNAFIESDAGLSSRRGQYAEKNGSRSPFSSVFDIAIRQNFGADLGGNLHKLQLSLDIFNFANILNNKWGANYFTPGDFNNYFLYDFEGYASDGTTPQFTYQGRNTGKDAFDIAPLSSRARMRIGLRYIFD